MNRQWNWLIGRKLSLGEVVDVFGESATVRHGDDETRVLLCELLEEDYKSQDRDSRGCMRLSNHLNELEKR